MTVSASVRLHLWPHEGDIWYVKTDWSDSLSLPVLENKFLVTLVKLDKYLETPLPHELDQNPNANTSTRLYLDGDSLSLADCNLLPKLHIVKVSSA